METPKTKELESYTNSAAPSLTLIFKNRRRMTWPMYLVGLGEFRPEGYDDEEEEPEDHGMESLRISAGEELVVLKGYNLQPIFNALTEGQAGVVEEHGERYAGLRKKGAAYVAKIEVTKLRQNESENSP